LRDVPSGKATTLLLYSSPTVGFSAVTFSPMNVPTRQVFPTPASPSRMHCSAAWCCVRERVCERVHEQTTGLPGSGVCRGGGG
jgi:hypothetical protein